MNSNRYYIVISLVLSVLVLNAYGQPQLLNLDQCRERAVENNKQASIAAKTAEKAAYTSKSLLANYFPKFSLSGLYAYTTTPFSGTTPNLYLPTYYPYVAADGTVTMLPNLQTSNGVPIYDPETNQPVFKQYAYIPELNYELDMRGFFVAGLRMEQPVYMGGKITAAYRMSKIGMEMADLNIKLNRSEVILSTDEAYWSCVKVNELLKTAEKYRQVLEELYRTVNNAYESGMVSSNDVMKVKVKINEAELNCQRAKNGTVLARMNLCHVVGLPLTTQIEVVDTFSTEQIDLPSGNDVTSRPEYELLTRQMAMKEMEKRLVRSDFLPNVGAMAAYSYMNGLNYSIGSDLAGVQYQGKLFDDTSISALLSVSIPVFHWGEGINKIRAAEADREIIELQRDQAVEMMTLELTKNKNEYEEAVLEVILTQEALEQSEENLKISEDHYRVGMETLAAYMEAQTLWQKSYSEWIEAQASMKLSLTRYLKAAGALE